MRSDNRVKGRLHGKVAWVTGAGRGLGRAIATRLAAEGAAITVTSRSLEDLESVAQAIESAGGSSLVAVGSVAETPAMRDAVDRIVDKYGRLDIVVNAAGISPTRARAENVGDELWRSILDVNLSGTFICCREAAKVMLEAGGGSIVNLSSVHATTGVERLAAYSASKGGVEALTKALAVEWAQRGVRINCIAPGYFYTPLSEPLLTNERLRQGVIERTPMRRIARPDELGGLVVYLASDEASFVTGSIYTIDGGWTAGS